MSSPIDSHSKLTDTNGTGTRTQRENATREGKTYQVSYSLVAIPSLTTLYVLRKSDPDVVIQHDVFNITTSSDEKNALEVQYLEGVVFNELGVSVTPLTVFAANRISQLNFPPTTQAFASLAADVSDDGLIYKEFSTIGSSAIDFQLSYLNPDTWYAQKIENRGNTTATVNIALTWQELPTSVLT